MTNNNNHKANVYMFATILCECKKRNKKLRYNNVIAVQTINYTLEFKVYLYTSKPISSGVWKNCLILLSRISDITKESLPA
jgi:hypothetical protein